MTEGTEWKVWESGAGRSRVSMQHVEFGDYWIPRTIEVSVNGAVNGGADPELYARVEVHDDAVPRLKELRLTATDPESRIRQSDLREVSVRLLEEDLVAWRTLRPVDRIDDEFNHVVQFPEDEAGHLRFIARRRAGRTSRDVTPELLGRVAEVYRKNITGHPAKAVRQQFQVSPRMAAEYISRARKRGLLPPTTRGKKKA